MFSITQISAIDNQVYDYCNDSSVNASLWQTIGPQLTETSSYLKVYYRTGQGTAGGVKTLNLSNLNTIHNITLDLTMIAEGDGDAGGNSGFVNFTVFNNLTYGFEKFGAGAVTNTSRWSIVRNVSKTNLFDVFVNGNLYGQTTGLTNVLWFNVSAAGTTSSDGEIRVSNVTYAPKIDISLITPADDYEITTSSVDFNCSATVADSLTLSNTTFYLDGVSNETKSLSGIFDSGYFSKTLPAGEHNWTCYFCDTNNNCEFASENRTLDTGLNISINSQTFNAITIEGNLETFSINLTRNPAVQITSANLYYNNTNYGGGSIYLDGNEYIINKTITVPEVGSQTNISFYWNINTQGDTKNSTPQNQTVNVLGIDDCSAYGFVLFNMSLKDEETQTLIDAAKYNTSIEVDINIYPVGSSTQIIEYYGNFSEKNNIAICLQNDLADSTYELDALITYDGDAYALEHYNLQNTALTNSSLNTAINLFDLKDSQATTFKISYKDASFLAIEDALIQIQRKYVSEGVSKTVEVPITDDHGEAIASLVTDDVIYTFIIVKDGVVLATYDNVRAICQNPTFEDCTISFNDFSGTISSDDYTTGDDFSFTLSFNKTSKLVQSIFSIPSSTTATVTLNVTKLDGVGTVICSDILESSSGTLDCTIPLSAGNGTFIAKVYKDGVLSGTAYFSSQPDPADLYGGNIVFLGLFLFMTLIGIGLGNNPMMTGFFLIIGGILAIGLNLFSNSGFVGAGATILWLVIAVVIVLIKGSNRQ